MKFDKKLKLIADQYGLSPTAKDISRLTEAQILRVKGLGRLTLRQIAEWLKKEGLDFHSQPHIHCQGNCCWESVNIVVSCRHCAGTGTVSERRYRQKQSA